MCHRMSEFGWFMKESKEAGCKVSSARPIAYAESGYMVDFGNMSRLPESACNSALGTVLQLYPHGQPDMHVNTP